jgi:O-antigen/teichoic acid export membrane protein
MASERGARSYASGARMLSIGIASTGVLTLAYFAIAGHLLDRGDHVSPQYSHLDVLWSVMFVIISVIYRPIEQLLSRTIADHQARGIAALPMRVPMTIQGGFALLFLAVALPLHSELANHAFDSETLYWVFVIGIVAYAASYFARGWLAGHKYFALYGGLVFMESASRIAFALAAAVGITHGQSAIALGIAAAPFVSLVVVPAAFASRATREARALPATDAALEGPAAEGIEEVLSDLSIRRGSGFAISVSGIQLAEQTLLNAAVLTIAATNGAGSQLPGIVFNVLLITRAPLQLFQAIQTSLLPHLAGLEVTQGREAFARAIRLTVLAIVTFAIAVAIGLLAIGPFVLHHVFHNNYAYERFGLALIAVGMGLHLSAGALNQAALARGQASHAAALWLLAAAIFVGWMLLGVVGDPILRTEVGYAGAAGLLALGLAALYRRGSPTASASAT